MPRYMLDRSSDSGVSSGDVRREANIAQCSFEQFRSHTLSGASHRV